MNKTTSICLLTGLAALSLGASGSAAQTAGDALFERAARTIEAHRQAIVELRRDLHRHPELSGEEERTAGIVAKRLRPLGLDVRTGVGGHGVVAVLRGGRPGHVVALRADMDAVASPDPDPVEFASQNPGVRHVCGHDVHTAVAIAVAEALTSVREDLAGTVVFLFQPSEENASGARAMIADGALADPRPDAIFAFHTAPLAVGQIGSAPGLLLAPRDLVNVVLSGTGNLEGAAPDVADLIDSLSTLGPDEMAEPVMGGFVAATPFESGPRADRQEWLVRGMVGVTSDSLREAARAQMQAGLARVIRPPMQADLDWQARVVAGVDNDPEIESAARDAIRAVVGDDGFVTPQGVIPLFSEDFGSFQEQVPGVMYWLGVSNPEAGTVGMPHSPDYVADEGALVVGARVMTAVLLDRLEHADGN